MFGTIKDLSSIAVMGQSSMFYLIDSPSMSWSLWMGMRLSIPSGGGRAWRVMNYRYRLLLHFGSLTLMPRGMMLMRLGGLVGWF